MVAILISLILPNSYFSYLKLQPMAGWMVLWVKVYTAHRIHKLASLLWILCFQTTYKKDFHQKGKVLIPTHKGCIPVNTYLYHLDWIELIAHHQTLNTITSHVRVFWPGCQCDGNYSTSLPVLRAVVQQAPPCHLSSPIYVLQ